MSSSLKQQQFESKSILPQTGTGKERNNLTTHRLPRVKFIITYALFSCGVEIRNNKMNIFYKLDTNEKHNRIKYIIGLEIFLRGRKKKEKKNKYKIKSIKHIMTLLLKSNLSFDKIRALWKWIVKLSIYNFSFFFLNISFTIRVITN